MSVETDFIEKKKVVLESLKFRYVSLLDRKKTLPKDISSTRKRIVKLQKQICFLESGLL